MDANRACLHLGHAEHPGIKPHSFSENPTQMCGAFLSYADYTEGDTRRNGPRQDQILCSKSSSAEDLKGKK